MTASLTVPDVMKGHRSAGVFVSEASRAPTPRQSSGVIVAKVGHSPVISFNRHNDVDLPRDGCCRQHGERNEEYRAGYCARRHHPAAGKHDLPERAGRRLFLL